MTSLLKAVEADRPNASKILPIPSEGQRVCIDLPGEEFKCYVHQSKVQIMLRKHRDVVFDIELFKGMTYTVEADNSDFYGPKTGKIFEANKKHKATFKDGEKFHLWIGRSFKGHLILKASSGVVLGKYQPQLLDPVKYGDDPGDKPAPILIAIKNPPLEHKGVGSSPSSVKCTADEPYGIGFWKVSPILTALGIDDVTTYSRLRPVAPIAEQHPTVAVVDGDKKGMPESVFKHFADGGGKSGLVDVDTNEVATRNWLYGQLAGTAAYAGDNWAWLKASINRQADGTFRLVSAKVAYVKGKVRIYFVGYSRVNPVFGPGGHGPGNAKILQVYAGVGHSGSAFKATAQAVGGTFKGNAAISFIFGSVTAWFEWKADAQKDIYDLLAAWLTALIKAIVVAALTAVLVAAILLALMFGAGITVAAIGVGALVVGVGFALNYAIEAGDKAIGHAWKGSANSDGAAAGIAPWLRDVGKWLGATWKELASKFPADYPLGSAL